MQILSISCWKLDLSHGKMRIAILLLWFEERFEVIKNHLEKNLDISIKTGKNYWGLHSELVFTSKLQAKFDL